ncbi:DUF3408 domain-containing protein [Polluticaenibacter yanchengensis]|uniref:DUF3408 domain-containing protein n=1 Tax=Polluticaenibacter yanchengensis TaxID=3014562 RepID=A0ABT4UF78_9BACT|nr:DUF3408 domain-containing protein [Chitinophagaceae bacterium LY-5]
MENEGKKGTDKEIDEQYLMSIMAGETKKPMANESGLEDKSEPEVKEKPVSKDKLRNKKTTSETYEERFLSGHSMIKRGDKSIYIRPEYHERLSRIVRVIGEDKIPLYAYLDNILEHHFDLFEKAITEDFNNKYKPIF